MGSPDYIIHIPGVGDVPKEREALPELWAPHGLEVEFQRIDWVSTDYEQRLEAIGGRILELFEAGRRVSITGDSGGGKPALSLYARYGQHLCAAVTICTKIEPYNLHPDTRAQFPNLVISSDNLPSDLATLGDKERQNVLCITGLIDKVAAPEESVLTGAHDFIINTHSHLETIKSAMVSHGRDVANFIQQS